jgi:hypothetical protein
VTTVPRLASITAALQRLDGCADAAVIERHAGLIHGFMLHLNAAYRARGFEIGGSDADGYYARPKTKTAGPARELRDLRLMCRKAVAGKITPQEWTAYCVEQIIVDAFEAAP